MGNKYFNLVLFDPLWISKNQNGNPIVCVTYRDKITFLIISNKSNEILNESVLLFYKVWRLSDYIQHGFNRKFKSVICFLMKYLNSSLQILAFYYKLNMHDNL